MRITPAQLDAYGARPLRLALLAKSAAAPASPACRHPRSYRVYARWQEGGDIGHVRVCPDCEHVEPLGKAVAHISSALRRGLRRMAKGGGLTADGPEYRWITIHPHGDKNAKGTPVRIRMHADGTAHVVGGVHGTMNYKVLTQLKSPEALKHEAMARRVAKREEAKAKAERMSPESAKRVNDERKVITDQLETARAEFLGKVSAAQGWEPVALSDEVKKNMPADTARRLERERARRTEAAAERVFDHLATEVIARANTDAAADLGDVAFDEIATPAIDKTDGLGYVAELDRLAEENGFVLSVAREQSKAKRQERLDDAEARGLIKSAVMAEARIEGLQLAAADARDQDRPWKEQGLAQPPLPDELADMSQAKELLVARQQYRVQAKELRQRLAQLEGKTAEQLEDEEKQPIVPAGVAIPPITTEQALARVEMDLQDRALQAAADELLTEVDEKIGARAHLSEHLNEGRFAQVEELAFGVTGSPAPIDRAVMDLLGNEGTAVLFASYLRDTLSPEELEQARSKLGAWHIRTQAAAAKEAVAGARTHLDAAEHALDGYPAPEHADAMTLLALNGAIQEQREHSAEARRLLGTTLGRLEALGELNDQLGAASAPKVLSISLGQHSLTDALKLGTALGLEYRTDFDVEGATGGAFIRLKREAFSKLIHAPDREQAELYQRTQAIKRGDQDVEGWLPAGFARRATAEYSPEMDYAYGQYVAPNLAGLEGAGLETGIRGYLGRCLAEDGAGSLNDLRMRVLSPDWQADNLAVNQRDAAGDFAAKLLNPEVTTNPKKAGALAEELLNEATLHDHNRPALDNQSIEVDDTAYEAMHQALGEFPLGKAAFAPLGDLSTENKQSLRDYFWQKHAKWGSQPDAAGTRSRREALRSKMEEVVREEADLFGDTKTVTYGDTPEGKAAWEQEFGNNEMDPWEVYARHMHGIGHAYQALQEDLQGDLLEKFAGHYQQATGRQLRAGQAPLHRALSHYIGTMSPDEYKRFSGGLSPQEREALDELRGRRQAGVKGGGQYASGSVKDLLAKIAEGVQKYNLQMFADQRHLPTRFTLGKTAENQLRRVWSQVAPNFNPKQAVHIPGEKTMSGRFVHQQRAIKMLEATGRLSLNHSTGSGKTTTGLGSYTDLYAQGKVKRGLFVVPPGIVGQFGQEMIAYLQPGEHRQFAKPSASAEERRAAYANPDYHLVATSHQAMRADLTWAVAQDRFAGNEEQAAAFLRTGEPAARGEAVRAAVKAQGWDFELTMLDEAHDELNRTGKPDSLLANAIDGLTEQMPYYLNSTATAVKNDPSECYDLLAKLRPDKFPAGRKQDFLRRYGLDTVESRRSLQYLMAPYVYGYQADTGVKRHESHDEVDLSKQQARRYSDITKAFRTAQKAEAGSPEWNAAVRSMIPADRLEGLPAEQQDAFLARAGAHLGSWRDMALYRAIHADPSIAPENNAMLQSLVKRLEAKRTADHDGGMQPGIVFTWSRESSKQLETALKAKGYRVGRLSGDMNGTDFDKVRRGFRPEMSSIPDTAPERSKALRDAADYDVLVATDAASVGLNLQRASWLHHYDQPWTAKTVIQRNGRIDRFGQTEPDVEISYSHSKTPLDRRRREVVQKKFSLQNIVSSPSELLDDTGFGHFYQEQYDEDALDQVDQEVAA